MKDINDIVTSVLTCHEETRDSDFKLICWVCSVTNPDVMSQPFSKVLWNYQKYNLPSFETIRRTRQKLQHDHPELRGKLYEKRMEKQAEYIDKFVRDVEPGQIGFDEIMEEI